MRQLLPGPADRHDADPAALDLWQAYAYPAGGRWLRANMVASADGAATWDGASAALGGPADRTVFRVLRGLADVVLVAAGTARKEDYGPVTLPAEAAERRRELGLPERPVLAVVTSSADLDPTARMFGDGGPRPIVLTGSAAPPERLARLREAADIVIVGDERVDLSAALDALEQRGLRRMLCEGGPSLLGQLVADDLMDELCLTVSPRLAGDGPPRITDGRSALAEMQEMRLAGVIEADGTLFLRWTRDRGAPD